MLEFLRSPTLHRKKALKVVLNLPVLLPVRLGQRAHAPPLAEAFLLRSNGSFRKVKMDFPFQIHARNLRTVVASGPLSFSEAG